MGRRWFVVGLMLALGVAYVVHGVAFRPAPRDVRIAVVRTWGELMAQPAHVFPSGERVRLGLESRVADRHGATLLYVLFERPAGLEDGAAIVVRHPDGQPVTVEGPSGDEAWIWLAGLSFHIAEHSVVFRVETMDGELLNEGELTATDRLSPWRPFENPTDMIASGDGPLRVSIRAVHDAPAVPIWWIDPLDMRDPADPQAADEPLARLVPETPDPWARLAATDAGFTLRVADGRVWRPTDRLLVRYEVNGAPAPMPPPDLPQGEVVDARVDWRFQDLGARPGDRFTFELLWCGEGFTAGGQTTRPVRQRSGRRSVTRRSNPVTITVP